MIFIDSNIPMYLVGAPHPHNVDAQRLLENLLSERLRLVTDAEVLQEILQGYVAIDRRDAIQPAFDAILGVVDQVLSGDLVAAERAKSIVLGSTRLSARGSSTPVSSHLSIILVPTPSVTRRAAVLAAWRDRCCRSIFVGLSRRCLHGYLHRDYLTYSVYRRIAVTCHQAWRR